jgi:N-acetylneuraminic acid mutarotase
MVVVRVTTFAIGVLSMTLAAQNLPDDAVTAAAVWTGDRAIVWGGYYGDPPVRITTNGWSLNPESGVWTALPVQSPLAPRVDPSAVWTGTENILWGGSAGTPWWGRTRIYNDGARYNPATATWTRMSISDAPTALSGRAAVWTGTEMLVWGGFVYTTTAGTVSPADGGRYNPSTDQWQPMTITNAPRGRRNFTSVWTGKEMVVWGGINGTGWPKDFLNEGGRYRPDENRWSSVTTNRAPSARSLAPAVWTGSEMLVWGGYSRDDDAVDAFGDAYLADGGKYDPVTDSWKTINSVGAPSARYSHSAVWTGKEMLIWGGLGEGVFSYGSTLNDGRRYDPQTDTWRPINPMGAPDHEPEVDGAERRIRMDDVPSC